MKTCIILHNMIVEDQRIVSEQLIDDEFDEPPNGDQQCGPRKRQSKRTDFQLVRTEPIDIPSGAFASLVSRIKEVRDATAYFQLQSDLIADLWRCHGNLN